MGRFDVGFPRRREEYARYSSGGQASLELQIERVRAAVNAVADDCYPLLRQWWQFWKR